MRTPLPVPEPPEMPRYHPLGDDGRRIAALALRYAALCALVLFFVGPFLWLVSMSLRGGGNIYEVRLIPQDMTIDYYLRAWSSYKLDTAFVNSWLVALATVGSNVLFCSLAAYPLARMRFRGRRLVFLLILSTMMVPFQLYMIPLFLLSLNLNLFNTLLGIIVPTSVGAFGIYLIKQYYETIPGDLEEAARIDGATELQIWALIMFPLTRPALAALAIFVFVASWSNFLWPLIITGTEEKYTLPIAVAKLSGDFIDESQLIAAGSVIAVLPIIVLFFFVQRWFIGGMTMGSVKG